MLHIPGDSRAEVLWYAFREFVLFTLSSQPQEVHGSVVCQELPGVLRCAPPVELLTRDSRMQFYPEKSLHLGDEGFLVDDGGFAILRVPGYFLGQIFNTNSVNEEPAIHIATVFSTIKGREHAGVFGREFTMQQVYRALAVIIISLSSVLVVVFVLTVTETFGFLPLMFETFSAFGTVGLSTGITPDLSVAGRLVITATMFAGRLGPLTLVLALVQRQQNTTYRYPEEAIRIG